MEYFMPWLVWGGAVLLLLACGVWMTRWIRPLWLRDLLRLVVAATLLVPAGAGSLEGAYAPAWIVFVFEIFLQTEGDPVSAMMMLTAGWVLAIVAALALTAWRLIRGRRSPI